MRGEHRVCQGGGRDRGGIIPACAGSTKPSSVMLVNFPGSSPHARGAPPLPSSRSRAPWDHPRMRGEHLLRQHEGSRYQGIIPACAGSTSMKRAMSSPIWGSSPHARGAPARCGGRAKRGGIIPACAGSTSSLVLLRQLAEDHPRMRGEHRSGLCRCRPSRGSSPHARGALGVGAEHERPRGIIPACAGSTTWQGLATGYARDHPRMRGEHGSFKTGCAVWWGSSPHARGAPRKAWALRARSVDHPRMRGEHYVLLAEDLRRDGIIPACAGSTRARIGIRFARLGSSPHARGARSIRACSIRRRRDHPRMRGEHERPPYPPTVPVGIIPACAGSTSLPDTATLSPLGSSPHARGAPTPHLPACLSPRIIPACAGSTCLDLGSTPLA